MSAANTMNDQEINWQTVCGIDDLLPFTGICAYVEGRQIAIFRYSDAEALYALDNYDPFSDAAVLSRGILGDIASQPVVASPIYKQHFNLETGQCLEDESVSVSTYKVRLIDQQVQIACDFIN